MSDDKPPQYDPNMPSYLPPSTRRFLDAIGYTQGDSATAAHQMAGHRTPEAHDCFAMNCRALGHEVEALRATIADRATVEGVVRTLVSLVRIGWLVRVGRYRSEPDDVKGEPYRSMLMAILRAESTDAAVLALLGDAPDEMAAGS